MSFFLSLHLDSFKVPAALLPVLFIVSFYLLSRQDDNITRPHDTRETRQPRNAIGSFVSVDPSPKKGIASDQTVGGAPTKHRPRPPSHSLA